MFAVDDDINNDDYCFKHAHFFNCLAHICHVPNRYWTELEVRAFRPTLHVVYSQSSTQLRGWFSTCVAPTMSLTHSSALIGSVFLGASGRKLPSWCTRSSTAVHRRTLRCMADDFALPAATVYIVQPPVQRSTVGSRAFSVAGPQVWNCLPLEVTSAPFLATFRIRIETFLISNIRMLWHFVSYTLSIVDLAVF